MHFEQFFFPDLFYVTIAEMSPMGAISVLQGASFPCLCSALVSKLTCYKLCLIRIPVYQQVDSSMKSGLFDKEHQIEDHR